MDKRLKNIAIFSFSIGISSLAMAQNGVYFTHADWEIACDTQKNCLVAGYHAENTDGNSISMLLQRDYAKPNVTAKLLIHSDSSPYTDLVDMKINKQSFGRVVISAEGEGRLSHYQTQAILERAKQNLNIEFISEEQVWQLSDKGLTAVLLKMDEVQQRVGTISAIISKGEKVDERPTIQPLTLVSQPLPSEKAITIQSNTQQGKSILQTLINSDKTSDCDDITNSELNHELEITSLSNSQNLVMTRCWQGAYNVGYGAWVMDKNFTNVQQFVTDSASFLNENQLHASHKVRGLGDCLSINKWTWNGEQFVHTLDETTGLCRGFAGGAWHLPTLNITVVSH